MDQSYDFEQSLNPLSANSAEAHIAYEKGIHLAAALLKRDWVWILGLLPLLVIFSWSLHFIGPLSTSIFILLTLGERLGVSLFLYLVTRRWIIEFSINKSQQRIVPLLRIINVNIFLWFIISFPTLFPGFQESPNLQMIFLFILFPLFGYLLQFYFYFIAVFVNTPRWKDVARQSISFLQYHRSLPLKLILAPLILSFFLVSVVQSFSPDARHLSVALLLDVSEASFWVFNVYLSLGVGLSLLANHSTASSYHNPYLQARLDSVRIQAPKWLSKVVSPASSIKFLIVASLIVYGNFVRLWNTAPGPQIEVATIAVTNKDLSISLKVHDEKFSFRGFQPKLFHIAGETGEVLSQGAPAILINGEPINAFLYSFPKSNTDAELKLDFKLGERAEDMRILKDVYLWYGQVKMIHLSPLIQRTASP